MKEMMGRNVLVKFNNGSEIKGKVVGVPNEFNYYYSVQYPGDVNKVFIVNGFDWIETLEDDATLNRR